MFLESLFGGIPGSLALLFAALVDAENCFQNQGREQKQQQSHADPPVVVSASRAEV